MYAKSRVASYRRFEPSPVADFDLLTNHAHVLVCVAREPGKRLRDIADCVGITERAAHRIVCELEAGGYLTRRREGRCNTYELHPDMPLPHELEGSTKVGELLRPLLKA